MQWPVTFPDSPTDLVVPAYSLRGLRVVQEINSGSVTCEGFLFSQLWEAESPSHHQHSRHSVSTLIPLQLFFLTVVERSSKTPIFILDLPVV